MSMVWFFAAVPIGFSLLIFRLIQSLMRDIADLRAGSAGQRGQHGCSTEPVNWENRRCSGTRFSKEAEEIGWDFYRTGHLLRIVLVALGVPIWAAIGGGAVAMLLVSGVLPLSLLGESLFDGIDHFALTAVPLFILTGDVLVRTGLSRKFLERGGGPHLLGERRLRLRYGAGLRHVLRDFRLRRGRRGGSRAHDHRATGGVGLSAPLCLCAGAAGACTGILIPPSIAYIVIGLVLGISAATLFQAALIPGILILASILVTNIVVNLRHAYEGGGGDLVPGMGRQSWPGSEGRVVRLPGARRDLLGDLFRPADTDRGRARQRWSSPSSWASSSEH